MVGIVMALVVDLVVLGLGLSGRLWSSQWASVVRAAVGIVGVMMGILVSVSHRPPVLRCASRSRHWRASLSAVAPAAEMKFSQDRLLGSTHWSDPRSMIG